MKIVSRTMHFNDKLDIKRYLFSLGESFLCLVVNCSGFPTKDISAFDYIYAYIYTTQELCCLGLYKVIK